MKIIIPRVSDATTQRAMRSFINTVLQAWFRLPFSSPPTIVSCRLAELLRVIGTQGHTRPIPIQAKASPLILQGHDVQTGTGKTAAFTLPLLQRLNQHAKRDPHPRTLVLTPTRELASQVAASVKTYGKYLSLRSTVVFGGVGINPQKHSLRRGVAILIATPGRLLDLIGQGLLKLSHIEALVLGEADRMLDMGFIREIRKIMRLLLEKRQNRLFSATYSNGIKKTWPTICCTSRYLSKWRAGIRPLKRHGVVPGIARRA